MIGDCTFVFYKIKIFFNEARNSQTFLSAQFRILNKTKQCCSLYKCFQRLPISRGKEWLQMNFYSTCYESKQFPETCVITQIFIICYGCLVTQSCLLFCDPVDCSLQASLSIGLSRQEYWNGLPFPSPGHLPDPGINPRSPSLAGGFFTIDLPGKPILQCLAAFGWIYFLN